MKNHYLRLRNLIIFSEDFLGVKCVVDHDCEFLGTTCDLSAKVCRLNSTQETRMRYFDCFLSTMPPKIEVFFLPFPFLFPFFPSLIISLTFCLISRTTFVEMFSLSQMQHSQKIQDILKRLFWKQPLKWTVSAEIPLILVRIIHAPMAKY